MNIQLNLLEQNIARRKDKIGQSKVSYTQARGILTRTSGFLDSYDFTLNPYSGCSFGCSYCYAAFFAKDKELRDNWGYWVTAKENALGLLRKRRKKPLINQSIYMSSVTDPYQPIEKDLKLTRSILQELAEYHQTKIYIQTRSPLVTRDIDIFKKLSWIQVNMTVTTDSEMVRKAFEPYCPSNTARLKAISDIQQAGLSACITMTPLLPIENAEKFAQALLATGVKAFIIQPFHPQKGKFVAGTRDNALKVMDEMAWTIEKYTQVLNIMKKHLPNIGEGKDGFKAK